MYTLCRDSDPAAESVVDVEPGLEDEIRRVTAIKMSAAKLRSFDMIFEDEDSIKVHYINILLTVEVFSIFVYM